MMRTDASAPSAPGVGIRPLSPADLPRVLAIEEAAFTTPWRASTFTNLLSRTDADLFAATEDGNLLGYTVCWTVLDQAELGNVAVAAEARGRGIGAQLVRTVLDRVRQRGARECFLEVRESNRAARALYEKLGFAIVGRRRGYYERPREDAYIMKAEV